MHSHYAGIVVGYGLAAAIIWLLSTLARPLVAGRKAVAFPRPWLGLGQLALAVAATLLIGQAYIHDVLLPNTSVALKSLNQAIIFSPILLAVAVHPQRFASGGLPWGLCALGLPIGASLAAAAVAAYALARGMLHELSALSAFILQTTNIDLAVQVLFEDIAIAALLLRLHGAVGARWTVVAVAMLFALAHVPAMLAEGETIAAGLPSLFISTGIGLLAMGAVLITRSIWWAWPVHSCMDMLQFYQT